MATLIRCYSRCRIELKLLDLGKYSSSEVIRYCHSNEAQDVEGETEEFRVLQILPPKKKDDKRSRMIPWAFSTPRKKKMAIDQDWTNVWPGPKTFHPAVVPLPLRQGHHKKKVPPAAEANTELMKIPNFLHLTPPAIEKHCEALKKFCTKWPDALEDEATMEKEFPIEIVSSDYCHSSPSIRNPLSRIISLRVKLKSLELDKHAADKMLRLVGEKHDEKTDYITITTDSCPLKKQNYQYAHYLLTALYFESWKYEDWEKEKSRQDMETYIFTEQKCYDNVKKIFDYNKKTPLALDEYGSVVEAWQNEGDSKNTIDRYKEKALKLLSLPSI